MYTWVYGKDMTEMIETPKRGRGRPVTTGTTPKHNLRIPDALWNEASALAAERGETTTALILRAMEREIARLCRAKAKAAD